MSISEITKVAQRQNEITEYDQSGFEPESVEFFEITLTV